MKRATLSDGERFRTRWEKLQVSFGGCASYHRGELVWTTFLRGIVVSRTGCAIYTRKSSEDGLEQEFNSLDAQREACEAYILSQKHEGWICPTERYDDGDLSSGTLERPALKRLLDDLRAGRVDQIVVYKSTG